MVIFGALGSGFRFGFSLTILNPLAPIAIELMISTFKKNYNFDLEANPQYISWIFGATAGSSAIGSMIGSVTYNFMFNRFGRRTLLIICQVIFVFSSLCGIISKYDLYELLVFGEIIAGISIGYSLGSISTLIMEISEPGMESFLNSIVPVCIEMAATGTNLLGIDVILGNSTLWQLMFGIALLISVIAAIGMYFGKESPRYLIQHGLDEQAIEAIQYYDYITSSEAEEKRKVIEASMHEVTKNLSILEVLKDSQYRRPCLMAACVGEAQLLSGVPAMAIFGTTMLRESGGLDSTRAGVMNFFLGSSNLVGVTIALFFLAHINHKKLLLIGLPIMAAVNGIYCFSAIYANTNPQSAVPMYCICAGYLIFGLAFSNSVEKICFFNGALITPIEALPATASLSVFNVTFFAFVVPLIFSVLQANLPGYAFIPFIVANLLFFVVFLLFYPSEALKSPLEEEQAEHECSLSRKNSSQNVDNPSQGIDLMTAIDGELEKQTEPPSNQEIPNPEQVDIEEQ
ncbi:unnamed protein product [Bursaphelenchus okinawaensis]|uniref:Major facilitator superfamily (MFS) profile domain-containing protein n=1 Tax=Bursaphelenchus okinawaensis TaxID=465554 RepID=A0A811L306_9BILA|nr:unnamed protein product [Bursaphelenchus okinawaensis]CAG9115684.1 unnamed protein product [Bursaphelenchus okinawaensis]